MHQQNQCSSNDVTIKRPHASRPTRNKRRGPHKMGKGSVQAAIAFKGYLSDVEV